MYVDVSSVSQDGKVVLCGGWVGLWSQRALNLVSWLCPLLALLLGNLIHGEPFTRGQHILTLNICKLMFLLYTSKTYNPKPVCLQRIIRYI